MRRSKTDTKYGLYVDITTKKNNKFIKPKKKFILYLDGKKINVCADSKRIIAEHYDIKLDKIQNLCYQTEKPDFKADINL